MTTETANTTLDIADIQNVVQIIDYAAEQGAFKGIHLLAQVVSTRARIGAFLDMVEAAQKAKAEAEAAAAAETTASETDTPQTVTGPTGPEGVTGPTGPDEETALAPGA